MSIPRPRLRGEEAPPGLGETPPSRLLWLSIHLRLGLVWVAVLARRAGDGRGAGASAAQVFVMLLLAEWLLSWALAGWQVQRRCWRVLLASDLLAAGALVLLAVTAYVPLFFLNVVWFLPLALLPRGLVTEFLLRRLLTPTAIERKMLCPTGKKRSG